MSYDEMWEVRECPCGHESCQDWHISPVAAVQGVSFTRAEAEKIVWMHNDEVVRHIEYERTGAKEHADRR